MTSTAQPQVSADASRKLRWQATGTGFVTLFAIVGIAVYGLPFFYDFFVSELGWSRATVTSGNAFGKLFAGPLLGFVAGWLVDRKGPRPGMIFGIAVAGAAVFGLSTVTGLLSFHLFYSLNAVGYVCAGPLPNQVVIARACKTGRGRALGFAYLGIGLGGAVVPLLSAFLVEHLGWRSALRVLAALIVVLALPAVLLLPRSLVAPAGDRSAPSDGATHRHLGAALRDYRFYLLICGSACSVGAVGGMMQHMKLYLTVDQGFGQFQAAGVQSTVLGVSLVGRVVMGWLADRVGARRAAIVIYGLVAAGIVTMLWFPTGRGPYGFAVIFGLGLGGEYLIVPIIAAELFGTALLGRLLGIVLTVDGLAEATAPMLIGYLRDVSGSYRLGFQAALLLAGFGLLAIAALLRRSTTPAAQTVDPQGVARL